MGIELDIRLRLNFVCKHCFRSRFPGSRGLCRVCYNDADIRARYPQLRRTRYPVDGYRRAKLPVHPTNALPGSPEKMAVMSQRAAEGYLLFHPDDATFGSGCEGS